ncbi:MULTISPECIES: hypothetical protein [unclassified Haladaptatus]|uniref:hypothetical protein n=1 Tax=unclassified Haladaptatus TaxID=2622732 RepID=UPI0023E84974|nr:MULTISPECIES: hypothetical protein [unclassified Haladaptatus]
MITYSTEIHPPTDALELTVEASSAPTATSPPLVTVCLTYVGDTPTTLYYGYIAPFNRFSAWNDDETKRVMIFPPRLNEQQHVIPDQPVGKSWPMGLSALQLESGRLWKVTAGDRLCEEYAVLTFAPSLAGYPKGTYTARDRVKFDDNEFEVRLRIECT